MITGAACVIHRWTIRSRVLRSVPGGGEPGIDVTLVFTDIQDSTRLWDGHLDAMQKSLQLHNHTVRALIAQCHGYEVKIIGDAFMVCCVRMGLGSGGAGVRRVRREH